MVMIIFLTVNSPNREKMWIDEFMMMIMLICAAIADRIAGIGG